MSDLPISNLSSLERFKQQRLLAAKPFPLWALLILCEKGRRESWYCNYFEGFKLLAKWLGPIEIPQAPASTRIPRLHRTYEIQEIATILKTSQENIYHGYQTQGTKLQQFTHSAHMPTEIPTQENGSTSN